MNSFFRFSEDNSIKIEATDEDLETFTENKNLVPKIPFKNKISIGHISITCAIKLDVCEVILYKIGNTLGRIYIERNCLSQNTVTDGIMKLLNFNRYTSMRFSLRISSTLPDRYKPKPPETKSESSTTEVKQELVNSEFNGETDKKPEITKQDEILVNQIFTNLFLEASKKASKMETSPKSYIPSQIHHPAISLNLSDVVTNPSDEPIITIFIGIINLKFNESNWKVEVDQFAKLFQMPDKSYFEIKGYPSKSFEDKLDSVRFNQDIIETKNEISKLRKISKIRIVYLGVGISLALFKGIEAIIREWNVPLEKKIVQLVTAGDTSKNSLFQFCKSLCINKLCTSAQFYNTTDYDPFGYFDVRNQSI
jgi:hypothetical protein